MVASPHIHSKTIRALLVALYLRYISGDAYIRTIYFRHAHRPVRLAPDRLPGIGKATVLLAAREGLIARCRRSGDYRLTGAGFRAAEALYGTPYTVARRAHRAAERKACGQRPLKCATERGAISTWTVFVLTPDGAVVVEEYARTRGQGRAEAAKRYNLAFISKHIVLVSNRNFARRHALYELVQAEVDARKAEREATEPQLDRWGRPILTGSAAWFADMAQACPPAVEDISFTSSLPRRNRAHWARARADALED